VETPAKTSWRIVTAQADQLPAALDLAFGHLSEVERSDRKLQVLGLMAAGELDARGVFLARRGTAPEAVLVCQPLVGGTGVVWLPRGEPTAFEGLIETGLRWLRGRGSRLAQVICLTDEEQLLGPLLRAGFLPAGPILYFRHDLAAPPSRRAFPAAHIVPVVGLSDDFLGAILQATYDGTHDFPELTGRRSLAEILAGHRAAGRHDPAEWFVAFLDARPAGVAFLTELEPLEGWELSYLGIVPEFRRRGLARALVELALERVVDRGGAQLDVVVDARNAPALQLYRSLGFTVYAQRSVALCPLAISAECASSGLDEGPR
jgi:ribosomal protein S18 acetylase RimI-like enzyme